MAEIFCELLSMNYFWELLSMKIISIHIDTLLSSTAGRLYLPRVCNYYSYSKDQLSKLFDSLIMSLFLYGLEIWDSAYQSKYLD